MMALSVWGIKQDSNVYRRGRCALLPRCAARRKLQICSGKNLSRTGDQRNGISFEALRAAGPKSAAPQRDVETQVSAATLVTAVLYDKS
jgi:hypothetical protein